MRKHLAGILFAILIILPFGIFAFPLSQAAQEMSFLFYFFGIVAFLGLYAFGKIR